MELQELERSLADYAEDLDIDPSEAARLEERVNLFETLKRKYGGDLASVLAQRDRAPAPISSTVPETEPPAGRPPTRLVAMLAAPWPRKSRDTSG